MLVIESGLEIMFLIMVLCLYLATISTIIHCTTIAIIRQAKNQMNERI